MLGLNNNMILHFCSFFFFLRNASELDASQSNISCQLVLFLQPVLSETQTSSGSLNQSEKQVDKIHCFLQLTSIPLKKLKNLFRYRVNYYTVIFNIVLCPLWDINSFF